MCGKSFACAVNRRTHGGYRRRQQTGGEGWLWLLCVVHNIVTLAYKRRAAAVAIEVWGGWESRHSVCAEE